MEMQVEELEGGVTNIMLDGRLDTLGVKAIHQKFDAVAEAKRAIIVDLSKVDFLSSSGIRMLLKVASEVKNKGGKLALFSLREQVKRTLECCMVDEVIVRSNRSDAIAAILSTLE
jgi:anti-anti-sigma factor